MQVAPRPKLPKFAAWPVKTDWLLNADEGTGRIAGADIRYSDYNVTWFVSNPESRRRPYPILQVDFSRTWAPEGAWSVVVRPVPSERVTRVRTLMREGALQRLRLWLARSPTPVANATISRLSFVCAYNELDDVLEYEEG